MRTLTLLVVLAVIGSCTSQVVAQFRQPQPVNSLPGTSSLSAVNAITEEDPTVTEAADRDRRVFFTARAGVALARYYGDSVANQIATNQRFGPIGGLGINILLSDHYKSRLFIETGIYYHTRGVQREAFTDSFKVVPTTVNGNPREVEVDSSWGTTIMDNLGYIQLPVMFKVELGSEGVRPYFSMGPVLGYGISAQRTTKVTVNESFLETNAEGDAFFRYTDYATTETERNNEETEDIEDFIPLELGLVTSAGVNFPVVNDVSIFLEARYDLGITRVYDIDNDKTRNNSICFMLGAEF